MRWVLLGACVLFGCSGEAFSGDDEKVAARGGESGETATGGATSGTGGSPTGGKSGSGSKAAGGTSSEGGEPATGGAETGGRGGAEPTGGTGAGGSAVTGGTGGIDQGGAAGCEEPTTFYPDDDGDGYGAPGGPAVACEAPDGFIERAGDCDDASEVTHPGAEERCDGVDLNCDPSDAEAECPTGCVPLSLTSGVYLICEARLSWDASRAACSAIGATLAKVRSAADHASIGAVASANGNMFWLGATDSIVEGTWRWETDGTDLSSADALWSTQEPKGLFADQDCMYGYFGRWYAQRCATEYPYVCELRN